MKKDWMRKRLWVMLIAATAVVLAILFHLVGFLQIELSIPVDSDLERPRGFVLYSDSRWEQTDPVLREQSELLDSASLFLPTRWNTASDINQVASLREETELFLPFEPILTVDTEEIPAKKTSEDIPDLQEWIQAPAVRDLQAMGLGDSPVSGRLEPGTRLDPVSPSLHLRALELQSGESRWLDPGAPEIEYYPDELWEPATVNIQILWGRPLGPASIHNSSGFSVWDRYLQELSESSIIYSQLRDGYWRLEWLP
jgi:hypothetical protein